jgi:transposase
MAAERLPMRKLRELIRMRLGLGMSGRAIARSLSMSPGTVSDYVGRVAVAKLAWPLPPTLDDDEALKRLLFPQEGHPLPQRPEPDWATVHQELRSRKHVTKLLLWQEYREQQPEGYEYSQFCERYARWAKRLSVTMRQSHRAGEKLFIDFSGDGIDVVDPKTGECQKARLFVAVLGASNLTYVEPTLSEDLPTWIGCHVRAFEFFGGVPEVLVPDNLKSAIKKAHRYEPEPNPTYAELARHYDSVIIPARPYRPRDKAKVEQAVLLAERWILAVLRKRTFYSLSELREAVKPLVERLNNRPMRRLNKSRRQLFEEMERSALRPLPTSPYEFADWRQPRVHVDYHVEFDEHFYSVPYLLVGEQLNLRATATTVELFRNNHRITSHVRSYDERQRYVTKPEHMPKGHREYAEWTPPRLIAWANGVGPYTAKLVEEIMLSRKHPEHGFRACLGVMRLRERYKDERIERACERAVKRRACRFRSVEAILRHNLDQEPVAVEEAQRALPLHGNVRGPGYYN